MDFDEKVVNQIVEKVVAKLAGQNNEGHQTENVSKNQPGDSDGVFQEMEICINAAVRAQKKLLGAPFEDRRRFIQAIRETGLANAEEYGRMEFEETGLGKPDDNDNFQCHYDDVRRQHRNR
jgi:aldehyde dehydrogenase